MIGFMISVTGCWLLVSGYSGFGKTLQFATNQ